MKVINTIVLSGANAQASQNSSVINSNMLTAGSAQAIVAGVTTISAAIQMQGSNDPGVLSGAVSPTNWTNIGSSVPVAANGTFIIPKTDLAYRWVRVAYTFTSGTGAGTVTIEFFGSGLT